MNTQELLHELETYIERTASYAQTAWKNIGAGEPSATASYSAWFNAERAAQTLAELRNQMEDYRIVPIETKSGFQVFYVWHKDTRLKQYALSEDEARMRISFHRRVFDLFDADQELAAWMGVVKHIIQAHA